MTCGTASSYSLPSCPKDSNHLSRWGGLYASKRSCHSDARNETNEVICTLFSETMNQIGCQRDRKSTRLNSSHGYISYAVFCLKKKKQYTQTTNTTIFR